jgi:hypothetical protein
MSVGMMPKTLLGVIDGLVWKRTSILEAPYLAVERPLVFGADM